MSAQPPEAFQEKASGQDRLQRELEVWKTMYDDLSHQMLNLERERDRLEKALAQKDRELAAANRLAQDLRQHTESIQSQLDAMHRKLDASE
ncbi:MAG: hypothetical protein AB7D07_12400 [Desulfovibrionaceae bacterium]